MGYCCVLDSCTKPVFDLHLFYPGQKRCKSTQQWPDAHTSSDRVTDKGTMTSFCKIIKDIKLLALALYYILSSVLTWHQWGCTEMKHDWGQLNDWLSVMWVRSGTLLKIPKYRYPHMFSLIFHICIVLIAAVWHGSLSFAHCQNKLQYWTFIDFYAHVHCFAMASHFYFYWLLYFYFDFTGYEFLISTINFY